MEVLFGKLDEAIDDMENGRVQTIEETCARNKNKGRSRIAQSFKILPEKCWNISCRAVYETGFSKKFRLEVERMSFNYGREEKKWRLWKGAEEKQLRSLGINEDTIEQGYTKQQNLKPQIVSSSYA